MPVRRKHRQFMHVLRDARTAAMTELTRLDESGSKGKREKSDDEGCERCLAGRDDGLQKTIPPSAPCGRPKDTRKRRTGMAAMTRMTWATKPIPVPQQIV